MKRDEARRWRAVARRSRPFDAIARDFYAIIGRVRDGPAVRHYDRAAISSANEPCGAADGASEIRRPWARGDRAYARSAAANGAAVIERSTPVQAFYRVLADDVPAPHEAATSEIGRQLARIMPD